MTTDARIERIESRQEVSIRLAEKLIEIGELNKSLLQQLVEWTQTPPSTDLGDTLRALLVGQQAMHGTLMHLGSKLRVLTQRVAELAHRVEELLETKRGG